jgi:5-oxoprolinase (ATP-hydrolysing) subunit A
VKPHGALYNQAEEDVDLARAIVRAIRDMDPELAVFGLAGGQLVRFARDEGLVAIDEGFADRAYTRQGKLVPRSEPNAVLESDVLACEQAICMVCDGRVKTLDDAWIKMNPQTLCLHGDGPRAVEFAMQIRASLSNAGIQTLAFHEQLDEMRET